MIGQTLSHYRILAKLGAGGMGEVYRARDERLGRDVALKVLRADVALDPERLDRFKREARAIAQLNHPNIVTLHSVEEAGGVHFLTMELVEGRTLSKLLAGGECRLDQFLELAVPLADAVSCAHGRGVVHRDLKPANIIIDEAGRLKVLDFGLAKLFEPGAEVTSPGEQPTRDLGDSPTAAGSVLGTPDYMSPEQAEGKAVDHRTDLFSLGVILYEMATGKHPFRGESVAATISSILRDTPSPTTELQPELPRHLGRIVARCLEKEADRRYQSALDLRNDLEGLQHELESARSVGTNPEKAPHGRRPIRIIATIVAAAVIAVVGWQLWSERKPPAASDGPARTMIAVLPFENLGAEADEYFADGITDAITARLAGIGGLGVISRQSTIQYKGSHKSMKEIGEELGVGYILEGTIQRERAGDPTSRVRIIPQLIGVPDDVHVWANTYDEEMTEVFRVQSEIAERVAHALSVTLLDSERKVLASIPTVNLEAYEFFLRGRDLLRRRYSWKNILSAVHMFEKAVELDPNFAAAWANLSISYSWEYYWTISSSSDKKVAARAAADRAGEIAPDLPDVQVAYGYYYYYGELDFDRAQEFFEDARSRLPNDADVLSAIAYVKRRQGHWQECVTLLERSAELNPRFVNTAVELGITYAYMRQYEKSQRYLERSIFLDPEHPLGYVIKALVHVVADGDTAQARRTLLSASDSISPGELGIELIPFSLVRILPSTYAEIADRATIVMYAADDTVAFRMGMAELYHQLGRDDEAHRIWNEELASLSTKVSPLFQPDIDLYTALTHASLGQRAEAIRMADEVVASSPVSADAVLGALRIELAALIYVRAEAPEQAIDQIELLLSIPSQTSRALFRLDPAWDPLRDIPRFRKLVEGPS
jgi:serine/threonine protein kinase/tetratricopeptide (TPR) repeat protein